MVYNLADIERMSVEFILADKWTFERITAKLKPGHLSYSQVSAKQKTDKHIDREIVRIRTSLSSELRNQLFKSLVPDVTTKSYPDHPESVDCMKYTVYKNCKCWNFEFS